MNRFSKLLLAGLCLVNQQVYAAEELSSAENVLLAQKAVLVQPQEYSPAVQLQTAIKSFRGQPSEQSWQQVNQALKYFLQQPAILSADLISVLHQVPGLNELGAKAVNTGSFRVWLFPQVEYSHGAYVQWREVKIHPAPPRRGRRRQPAPAPTVTFHLSYVAIPANIVAREAKIVESGNDRYLLLAGSDRDGRSMWLKSYHGAADGWKENNYPLASIPPFLLNNLNGRISFTASELVIAVDTGRTKTIANGAEEPLTYKIGLHLLDGRYVLDGKLIPDTPQSVVHQFAQAVQSGRTDLAKAWLADTSLANIPRYLGLNAKANGLHVVNLSGAPAGVHRFRWITFDKDDLILDVARGKTQQWIIKAIFVAPADPVWQRIAKNLPTAVTEAKVHDVNQSAARKDGTNLNAAGKAVPSN